MAANSAKQGAVLTDQATLSRYLHYYSLILIISLTTARIAFYFVSPVPVSDLGIALLVASGLAIQFFLRRENLTMAARLAVMLGMTGTFFVALANGVGRMTAPAGYLLGILLSAMILRDRSWLYALIASWIMISVADWRAYLDPNDFVPKDYILTAWITEISVVSLASTIIAQLYTRQSQSFSSLNSAHSSLQELFAALAEKELYYRSLMEVAADGFILLNQHGTILDVNQATCDLVGYKREELLNLDMAQVDPEASLEWLHQLLAHPERGREIPPIRSEVRHKDGYLIPIETRLQLIEMGGDILIFANVHDRRSEVKAQTALQEAAERSHLIANNIPAWVLYLNRDFKITYYNERFATYFNLDSDQILSAEELFGDALARVRPNAEKLFRGEELALEFEGEGRNGWHFLTNISAHIVNGEVVGQFVMIRDYTERFLEKQELQRKNELLKIITDNLPARITYIVGGNELRFWNQPFAELYNCSGKEPPLPTSVAIPDDIHNHWLEIAAGLDAGQVGSYELNLTLPNGEEQYSHFKLLPHIEDGEVKGIVTLALDITELRNTQATLNENLARFRMVTDNVPARLAFLSPEGNVLYVNQHVENQGVKVSEAIGRNPLEYLPPDYGRVAIQHFRKALGGEATSFEMPLVLPNGQEIVERSFYYPHMVNGKVEAVFTMNLDVTDIRQAEEALKQAQKLESLGILAGGIAHDFNNLLVAMLGQSSLALVKLDAEHPAREHIIKAVTAAEQAATLTNQMLAYSGKGSFSISPLDINNLIRQNIDLFEVSLPKNIKLKLDLAEKIPVIEADHAQIQQIIMNLIINAGHAIGSRQGQITITTRVENLSQDQREFWEITGAPLVPGEYVSLQVEDDGIGMSRETIAQIFDPFFTTKEHGSGLGLAAVVGIIRGHQGGIYVESEPGRGAIFHLLFPTIAAGSYQEPVNNEPTKRELPTGPVSGTVLIIDDEPWVGEAVADILQMEGLETFRAVDGPQGLALYKEHQAQIDLVLLDLMMPEMNGEEVFLALREIDPDVKVILSSGYSEAEATRR
ncbi:MAG: PAS domain S-box protein, partial [Anaerolineales bacterium]|nr:PAS domain S-box protein [Anaerolineales bacterium]